MLSYFHRLLVNKSRQKIYRFFNGQAQVSVGQKVLPYEIVGVQHKKPGFRVFRLDEILGVDSFKAGEFLVRSVGSYLIKGETIAKRTFFLGLGGIVFKSPVEGVIKEYDRETGQLMIEYPTQVIKVPSGVEGEIAEVLPNRRVVVQSSALVVRGRLGVGFRREGIIKVLAFSEIPVLLSAVTDDLFGKIVVAGSSVSREVLYKLTSIGAKGLITGGIEWRDFSGLRGTRGQLEDVGLTLVVLGGFGNLAIDKDCFSFLQKFDGRLGIISGVWKKLLLPCSKDSDLGQELEKPPVRSNLYNIIEPKNGDQVRILTLGHFGEGGMIEEILGDEIILESEIKARGARIRLENGESLNVPLSNLEVIG